MKIMIETEISTDNGAFYKKYSIRFKIVYE